MNESFYERCKKVVSNLELTYEQGIARDVILNELDMLEKQAKDYQTRFNKAIELLNNMKKWSYFKDSPSVDELLNILKGSDKE